MYKNILILGRGIGQVMFQNNALSGGLMLLGIAFNSWQLAVLSVLGTVVSTLTRRIFVTDCMVLMGHWSVLQLESLWKSMLHLYYCLSQALFSPHGLRVVFVIRTEYRD